MPNRSLRQLKGLLKLVKEEWATCPPKKHMRAEGFMQDP